MLQAVFTDGVDEITVHGLTQWDVGQEMEIVLSSLPAEFQVHFGHKRNDVAYVVAATATDGVATVAIPNVVLQQSSPVKAWIYLVGVGTGETVKTINLPIIARTKPSDYAYTEVEILNYESVIRKAQGEMKAPYIGENNNWYVWDEEAERFVDSGICAVAQGSVASVDDIVPAQNGNVYLEAVRTVDQTLSATQKEKARKNIGAASEDHIQSIAKGGTGATDAETARKNLGAAMTFSTTAFLIYSGWSSTSPYIQTIDVAGILASDTPLAYPYKPDTWTDDNMRGCLEGWDCVDRIVAGDGTITAYCYDEKPADNIAFMVKVVR